MTPSTQVLEQSAVDTHIGTHPDQAHAGQPSRRTVIRAIRREVTDQGVACTPQQAVDTYNMLERAVAQIRDGGPGSVYYLKQGEINDLHEVLAAVMPGHVTDPAPGTAHAQLQRRLLQGNELSLVHTSDLVGGQTYCSVRIGIRAA